MRRGAWCSMRGAIKSVEAWNDPDLIVNVTRGPDPANMRNRAGRNRHYVEIRGSCATKWVYSSIPVSFRTRQAVPRRTPFECVDCRYHEFVVTKFRTPFQDEWLSSSCSGGPEASKRSGSGSSLARMTIIDASLPAITWGLAQCGHHTENFTLASRFRVQSSVDIPVTTPRLVLGQVYSSIPSF